MNQALREGGRGGLAGAVATVAMSAFMMAAWRAGALGTPPPRKVTDRVLRTIGVRPWRRRSFPATALNHLAFGAAAGVPFAVVAVRWLGNRRQRVVAGAAYGVAVWAVMYQALLPALGLMPRPRHDRAGRPATMALAHVVYGALLGRFVEERSPAPQPPAEGERASTLPHEPPYWG